jgi:hypothetical protein
MSLPGYDAWLERPYQEMYAAAEREEDDYEPDWEAIAEAKADARLERQEQGWDFFD